MAGLYGFYSRRSCPLGEARGRLAAMRARMTSRLNHRFAEEATEFGGIGITGPGAFDGNVCVHRSRDFGVAVVDGEAYHVTDLSGRPAAGAAVWPAVLDRLVRPDSPAIKEVDGIYNVACLTAAPEPLLKICNDRYGSRRLYYSDAGEMFVFASEMAPVVASVADAAVDWEFVVDSVSFGSPIDDRTWIRGVKLFPPAGIGTITRDGVDFRRYWSFADLPPPSTYVAADRIDHLHELWVQAVKARIDGRCVGLQLSGGLDSRLILATARVYRPDLITATYGEPGSDDVRFARRTAEAARVPWLFWPVPGAGWLERRIALSVQHDGVVDIVNGHHAGLVEVLGGVMDFELSGYLGDAVMGATGLHLTARSALYHLPYWPSPVGLEPDNARERIESMIAQTSSPYAWMAENKWRRATNAWPHLAVDALEVRKPFMDYALVDFCAGLPTKDRALPPQRELLRRFYPDLARVPWQKTGVAPTRGRVGIAAMKAVRAGYRAAVPIAKITGRRVTPWIRTACDVSEWCADPAVRRTIAEAISDPAAILRERFELRRLAETLSLAFDAHTVAVEVPLNLYRAERVLRRFRSIAADARVNGA